jgi:transposase-like protein
MDCPHCQSQQIVKNGREARPNGALIQRYRCRDCGKQFNERTGTPMARLRAPSSVVAMALNSRTEGTGARATGRVLGKSHSTILRWEERLDAWSPPAPGDREVTLEGDEVYTRVGENRPPPWSSEGWTIHFIERDSRYWVSAMVGYKDELLFQRGTQWAQGCPFIWWFAALRRRCSAYRRRQNLDLIGIKKAVNSLPEIECSCS